MALDTWDRCTRAVAMRVAALGLPGLTFDRVKTKLTGDLRNVQYPLLLVSVEGLRPRFKPIATGGLRENWWPVATWVLDQNGPLADEALPKYQGWLEGVSAELGYQRLHWSVPECWEVEPETAQGVGLKPPQFVSTYDLMAVGLLLWCKCRELIGFHP